MQDSPTGFESKFLDNHLQQPAVAISTTVVEIASQVYFLKSFGNAGIVITSEGVVVIDGGNPLNPNAVLGPLRMLTSAPVHTVVYTHGHADHAANAQPLLDEAAQRGYPRPRILAHRNVPARMERYRIFYGLNDRINRAQFALPEAHAGFPMDHQFVRPDETYDTTMTFQLGELTFVLTHAKGETDDATWILIPERKCIFSGDCFISSCPNAGNPFKIQRFVTEWATALEHMATCDVEKLAPGHGDIISSQETIKDALLTTAQALRYLDSAVIYRLNKGQSREQILNEVRLPTALANHPSMAPVYGCQEFLLRDLYRRYAGWYDGNPTHLSPSRTQAIAQEVVALSSPETILARAQTLAETHPQLALHLLDFVLEGCKDSSRLQQVLAKKVEILAILAKTETSFIKRSILNTSLHNLFERMEGKKDDAYE